MRLQNKIKKLAYENEVLQARRELQIHFHQQITKAIYENIGQMLSLVRVELSYGHIQKGILDKVKLLHWSDLVAQAIRDLRVFSTYIQLEDQEVLSHFSDGICSDAITSNSIIPSYWPHEIEPEQRVIICSVLLDILKWVKADEHVTAFEVDLDLNRQFIMGMITCATGFHDDFGSSPSCVLEPIPTRLTTRMQRISGRIKTSVSERAQIKIEFAFPLKPVFL